MNIAVIVHELKLKLSCFWLLLLKANFGSLWTNLHNSLLCILWWNDIYKQEILCVKLELFEKNINWLTHTSEGTSSCSLFCFFAWWSQNGRKDIFLYTFSSHSYFDFSTVYHVLIWLQIIVCLLSLWLKWRWQRIQDVGQLFTPARVWFCAVMS